jgi:hypothetical protein
MSASFQRESLVPRVKSVLASFVAWLDRFGEDSFDHQSFFAGRFGGGAKRLYYRKPLLGILAVGPMIACEAFLPSARKLFYRRMRFPIADAHYAMGFQALDHSQLGTATGQRAIHFLEALKASRCAGYKEYCWGYPFDWVTRNGVIPSQTPLITSTPYCFEAFLGAFESEPSPAWREILESIARHAAHDIKDFPVSANSSSCSYTPFDGGGVVNAAAYRAFLLTTAARALGNAEYGLIAERNLRFVLECQNADGSSPYAVDGVRGFVDHFHTCFVMKALAKIHAQTGDAATLTALSKGVEYYLANLFDVDGLPKPFARAPRLTVYKRELYDCAECINLCLLLRDRFPQLASVLHRTVNEIVSNWIQPSGAFRARRLHVGWDDVPMHRWGQSQMFRSLALYLKEFSLEGMHRDLEKKTASAAVETVQ